MYVVVLYVSAYENQPKSRYFTKQKFEIKNVDNLITN